MDARSFALPELGRLTGRGDTANVETVLRTSPDLIFDYGTVNPTYASLADRVQAQTGVPALLIDGGFEKIPAAYRTLGAVLGEAERAAALAAYAERVLAEAHGLAAGVPADHRPRVYYARGPDGLDTALPGSINGELIDRLGAVNVAGGAGQGNLAKVSPEQVLAWDPEIIVTNDRSFRDGVGRDPRWRGIRAVADGRVYKAPDLPFGWFDQPPSVNRLIGLPWLAHLLYPDRATGDIRDRTREFYRLFYRVELTDDQLDRLLADAVPRRP
jgi:iron complex transport system substrate-binding protein